MNNYLTPRRGFSLTPPRLHSREFHVGFPLSFFSHGVVGDVVDVYDTRPPPVQCKPVSSVTCSQAYLTYSLPPLIEFASTGAPVSFLFSPSSVLRTLKEHPVISSPQYLSDRSQPTWRGRLHVHTPHLNVLLLSHLEFSSFTTTMTFVRGKPNFESLITGTLNRSWQISHLNGTIEPGRHFQGLQCHTIQYLP